MELFRSSIDIEQGLALASRVHRKYRPVFDDLSDHDRAALAFYFLPHRSKKEVLEVTRPRVIKWYCPFADQRAFPSGHRYCINVYTGCEHACQYCYAVGYASRHPGCKKTFRNDILRDLDALDAYDVPPGPVHISNSTDPLQPLEREHRHTLFVLEQLARRRHRFTTVTLLTKNPAVLMDEGYVRVLHELEKLPSDHPRAERYAGHGRSVVRVECSLAFFDDRSRELLDPAAPSVENRMAAIRFLRQRDIPVLIRIDPLFPRDPLPRGKRMVDFGLRDVQPKGDLENLVRFGREVGAAHLVYSIAKITRPRFDSLSATMEKMKNVYTYLASGEPLAFRGGSWRLPSDVSQRLVSRPLVDICRRYGIQAKSCKANLISTP